MKKMNRKLPLVLFLFASMFSTGLMNQKSYVTKAVEVGKYEISTDGALGSVNVLNNVGEFEERYPTPNGISWTSDMHNAYGWEGWRLHLGGGATVGHATLKLDNDNYYVTKVIVNARRYIATFKKPMLYVNNENTAQNLNTHDVDYTFDVSQDKKSTIKIGTKNEGGYITKIQVYYAANLDLLVRDITAADTCNEYNKAADFRTRYNYLTSNDYTSFNNTKISDVDQNGNTVEIYALEKLEYMEYLTSLHSAKQNSQSLTQQIAEKKSIGWIVLIGTIVMCMSVYSIMIKRKWNKQK